MYLRHIQIRHDWSLQVLPIYDVKSNSPNFIFKYGLFTLGKKCLSLGPNLSEIEGRRQGGTGKVPAPLDK